MRIAIHSLRREFRVAILVAVVAGASALAIHYGLTETGIGLGVIAAVIATAFYLIAWRPARIPRGAVLTIKLAGAMREVDARLSERGATSAAARRAHFISALCVAWQDGHLEEFEGRVDGTLVWPPRGDQGFGYDPMFLPDGHMRTFGEMPSEEKHDLPPRGKGLSHRARAFVKLAEACLERR